MHDDAGEENVKASVHDRTTQSLRKSSCGSTLGFSALELNERVTALVDELESARANITSSGVQIPRALEAAGSALGPLVRLKQVTGDFPDLALMPWLPQLLSVFEHVLHTAVSRVENSQSVNPTQVSAQTSGVVARPSVLPDSGAGDTAAGGTAIGKAPSCGSARKTCDSMCHANPTHTGAQATEARVAELEAKIKRLQEQVHEQTDMLNECEARERQWAEQVADYRQREEDWVSDLSGLRQQRDTLLEEQALYRSVLNVDDMSTLKHRVIELERQSSEWRSEHQIADDKLNELVSIVRAAVEDTEVPRGSPDRFKEDFSRRRWKV